MNDPAKSWRVVAASTAGTAHLLSGAPCQDAHIARLLTDDTVILIAADGSGSAPHSDTGARIATQRMLESIWGFLKLSGNLENITATIAKSWLTAAVKRLAWQAKIDHIKIENDNNKTQYEDSKIKEKIKDYRCTLLAAIVSPTHVCCIQVGDGAILTRQAHGQWRAVFWPQHGEFLNETFYITNPSSIEHCEFYCAPAEIDEVALFTDGLETLALNSRTRQPTAFIEGRIQAVRNLKIAGINTQASCELEHYLAAQENICQYTDDDKTLLMASRLSIQATTIEKKSVVTDSTDAQLNKIISLESKHKHPLPSTLSCIAKQTRHETHTSSTAIQIIQKTDTKQTEKTLARWWIGPLMFAIITSAAYFYSKKHSQQPLQNHETITAHEAETPSSATPSAETNSQEPTDQ